MCGGHYFNILCLSITVILVLTMGFGQAVLGAMNLNACPAQPKLPALMLAAGVTAALFPICLALTSWLFFHCASHADSPGDSPSSSLRRAAKILSIASCIAVPVASISLSVICWFIYEREFTVVLDTEPKHCRHGVCPNPRGPNPRISLEDALHPRYCSGQLISGVHITCSPVFLLMQAAFFLLPAVLIGFLRFCSKRGGSCAVRHGFEKLRNQKESEAEKAVINS